MPKSFDAAVGITRKFAANPAVAAELAKLKSAGVSQSMFPMVPQVPQGHKSTVAARCRLFASTGHCRFGNKCKFTHISTPAPGSVTPSQNQQSHRKCDFCSKMGHTEDVCNFKKRLLGQLPQTAAVAVSNLPSADSETKTEAPADGEEIVFNNQYHFVFAVPKEQRPVSTHSLRHSGTARSQHNEVGNKACAPLPPSSALEDRRMSCMKGTNTGPTSWVPVQLSMKLRRCS